MSQRLKLQHPNNNQKNRHNSLEKIQFTDQQTQIELCSIVI